LLKGYVDFTGFGEPITVLRAVGVAMNDLSGNETRKAYAAPIREKRRVEVKTVKSKSFACTVAAMCRLS
jgi:hypothetical protein